MTQATPLSFDTSLPLVALHLQEILGDDPLVAGHILVVRDATGQLTVVIREKALETKRQEISEALSPFSPYVDATAPVLTIDELFDDSLRAPDAGLLVDIDLELVDDVGGTVALRLVDRRIIGADWLLAPMRPPVTVPIVVFSSLKGGVGRSTALAVAAAAFAEDGLNVLAIDLDLEAPGIGSTLLGHDDLPLYGTLDYFVEENLRSVSPNFIQQIVAPSPLTRGRGLVTVAPAIGLNSLLFPANVLGKISRAYLDKVSPEGTAKSFLWSTRHLVEALNSTGEFDVILVDARAGLHESTAASILGLGGTVLLFGVDTPQTFDGYKHLFSYLKQFAEIESPNPEWRRNLRMVHAKASADPSRQKDFRDRSFYLIADTLYEEAGPDDMAAFNFDLDDTSAPHYAWAIPNDATYFEFDPLGNLAQLERSVYLGTFNDFILSLRQQIGL